MSLLGALTLLLQGVIPLALLARVAFAERRRPLSLALDTLLAAIYLVAIGLAAPWLAMPWYLAAVFAAMLPVALARGALHARADRHPRTPIRLSLPGTAGVAARFMAALLLLGVAAVAAAGRQRSPENAVDVHLPLRGGTYLVASGGTTELVNPHLKTRSGDRFRAYRGQSYAVDLVRVGGWGSRLRSVTPRGNGGYAIFGDSLRAPCSGRVVRAMDGHPDGLPPGEAPATLEGNHVILDCDGIWIVLAHLQQGTVAVPVGRELAAGDFLGQVGNSGRSDEPHLHIHAQRPGTEAEPLSGAPVPISFDGRAVARGDRVRAARALH